MLCLSGFELYSRWVPLKQPGVGTSESWLLARFRRQTVFMNQTEYIKFIVHESSGRLNQFMWKAPPGVSTSERI